MINESLKTQFIDALNRFQLALRNHDHPNLALQEHLHPQYLTEISIQTILNQNNPKSITQVFPTANVLTIDLSLGDFFNVNMSENINSIVVINPPGNNLAIAKTLFFNQSGDFYSVTNWPANFNKLGTGGTLDDITQTAYAIDRLMLTSFDNGFTYLAELEHWKINT